MSSSSINQSDQQSKVLFGKIASQFSNPQSISPEEFSAALQEGGALHEEYMTYGANHNMTVDQYTDYVFNGTGPTPEPQSEFETQAGQPTGSDVNEDGLLSPEEFKYRWPRNLSND